MNFHDRTFLIDHCKNIFSFYDHCIIDEKGGYFQNFYDNGEVFATEHKQLVSSSRIVVNYALGSQLLDKPEYLTIAQHGLDFIELYHWQSDTQTYAWTLNNNQPNDMTQQAYGYAFVLLAYAAAKKVGLISVQDKIDELYQLLEQRFWQAEYGLYADTLYQDEHLSEYRGQNANMHICEAMISAYEATQDDKFLKRAQLIAANICQRQAALTNGLVWEHFTADFQIDLQYNKHDPKNLYRPWGFQPGHQTEWAKLLLQLNRYTPQPWLVSTAQTLFNIAYNIAWDAQYGGLIYGFDTENNYCDDDKYFWVQAESIAAAALLYQVTQDQTYLDKYHQLWQYSWQHMIDHQFGAWFRVLKRNNEKYSNEKSTAGAKCDYHTLGACFEVIKYGI